MKEFFININETMTEEDREILQKTSYCRDEFDNIVKGSYLEFWKFLIEKYKTANQKIKAAEHKCNLDVQSIKDYVEKFKREQELEKEKIVEWWENRTKEEVQNAISNCSRDYQEKMDAQFNYMQAKKDEEMKNLYDEMQEKLIKQEYDLKAWQADSVRQVREKVTADYEWKLEEQRLHYQNSLFEQKNYYENKFLLVKILLKFYKKREQIKNKIGKVLKKN